MIRIAIDGPGGAGKSSIAKEVAKRLEIIYVDTGALYRTIGLYMVEHNISTTNAELVVNALGDMRLDLKYVDGKQVIFLDGVDVGDRIRAPEISMAASNVSAIPGVRDYLLDTQRDLASSNSLIMDGRDIGTVILPNAEVKIFLTANPEARAKRRYNELIAKGKSVTYEQVYSEMVERDTQDSTRSIAPCVPADDAVIFDNSNYDFEGSVNKVIEIINKKSKKKTGYMKLHRFLAPMFRFFFGVRVVGVENIPKDGGYLICSNHIAARDPVVIAACSPRQISFVAKKELFYVPIVGRIIKALGAIKLDRGGSDVGAIKKSVELAKSGALVCIFPQGHRYAGVNPELSQTKHGAGLLAYHSKCGCIPVCIKTKKNKYSLFSRPTIIFGKPIPYSELGFTEGGNAEYKTATNIIFEKVLELGNYANKKDEAKGE